MHYIVLKKVTKKCPHKWLCLCNCGKHFITTTSGITQGLKKSCGCQNVYNVSVLNEKYNLKANM